MKRSKPVQRKRTRSVDFSDIPELTADFWRRAKVVRPPQKLALSVRLDSDVLQWLRKQGRGYQSLMNAILRSYMEAVA